MALDEVYKKAKIAGDVQRSECEDLIKKVLKGVDTQTGAFKLPPLADKFSQKTFNEYFGKIDKENVGAINKEQMTELV